MIRRDPYASPRIGARTRPWVGRFGLVVGLLVVVLDAAPGRVVAAAEAWTNPRTWLEVELDPASGELRGFARLALARHDACAACGGAGQAADGVAIELLEALSVESAMLDGLAVDLEPLPSAAAEPPDASKAGDPAPPPARRYRVVLGSASAPGSAAAGSAGVAMPELAIRYRGVLRQDWAAGERPGEIHNFRVSAHIGTEGIYLSEEAAWYPRLARLDEDGPPEERRSGTGRTDFETRVRGVPGMLLVASGNRVDSARPREAGADETWRTPFPLHGLTIAGGPKSAHHLRAHGVDLYALLGEDSSAFGERLLEAAASYLALYQPLLGPYPFRELTIVENFFSSGFAYPGFTLLSSQVLQMGEGSLRPGYLDHELLHAWWGNGVLGEPDGAAWWEALTSYCANLMRPTLEGRPEETRAQRRSILEGLSQLSSKADRPLATFGLEDGASGFIGYQKGSLVFAQLARELGQETLWYALRTLAATRMGEPTSWRDLQVAFERASGRDLDEAFDLWVRGSGLPDLSPRSLAWDASNGTLRLTLGEPAQLAVSRLPLRLHHEGSIVDVEVSVPAGATELVVRSAARPLRVEVDPDFETLRRIPEAVWMPAISGLRPPRHLRVLRGGAESAEAEKLYDVVAAELQGRFEDAALVEESRIGATPESTGPGHVLVLGDASALPWVSELLATIDLRIDTAGRRFSFEGAVHTDPAAAVLACVRRPQEPGAQVCVYWGNSPAALARSHLLTFYGGDSLLVFDGGRPVARRRFERTESYEVPAS
jgi:hypothetical protein